MPLPRGIVDSSKHIYAFAKYDRTDTMTSNKLIAWWLLAIVAISIIMVVLGGLVRLTSSGLSMVEWHIVTGIIPPLSEADWQAAFEKYKQFPEFKLLNSSMQLSDYKFIYLMEYAHRMLGRFLGLFFGLPLLYFWRRKIIPKAHMPRYIGLFSLLVFQGIFGWYMVLSGLSSMPHVSHYRLTGHLLLALAFIGICFWTALSEFSQYPAVRTNGGSKKIERTFGALFLLLIVQLALGGLVAGLKAGLVSSTFPQMQNAWIPSTLWTLSPWYINFFENSFLIHFLHRWNGFILLFGVIVLLVLVSKDRLSAVLSGPMLIIILITLVQVMLGVLTILTQVPVPLASMHQTVAIFLFLGLLAAMHKMRYSSE